MNGYQWLYRSLRSSHLNYANKHDYQYVQITRPSSSVLGMEIAWLKVSIAIQSLLAGYDWVMFLDADTEVSEKTPAIESLEQKSKYLYAVKGYSGRMNSGVLIFKNHKCVIDYLKKSLFYAEKKIDKENDVGWGENGHLIQYSKDACFLQLIHCRWNNNQYLDLKDFIRHYSFGPMKSLFKSSWLDTALFCLHFHCVCKISKWFKWYFDNNSSFNEKIIKLTQQVIKEYPAIVDASAYDRQKEFVVNG